jgi:TatD DNase family protein
MLASEKGRALIADIPQERLLTETDAPFASVAGSRLYPWDAEQTLDPLSAMWGVDAESVGRILRDNLRRLGIAVTKGPR